MLFLYSGSGSQSLKLLSPYSSPETEERLLYSACQLMIARDQVRAANLLASENFRLWEATNDFADEFYVLMNSRDIAGYEEWRKQLEPESTTRKEYRELFSVIADTLTEVGLNAADENQYVRFVVCQLETNESADVTDWRNAIFAATRGANNQAIFNFRDAVKLTEDGLNFRSKTEIRMYQALVKRGLLVLPLPVAVLGDTKVRREPDFVIAYKGKMGILEIHGEKWHPPETAAKEAERRRALRNLGVSVYEVFDAQRCWNDPERVVSEFLRAFEN